MSRWQLTRSPQSPVYNVRLNAGQRFKALPVVIKTPFRFRQEMFNHPGQSVCRAEGNWTSSPKTFHLSSKSLLKVFRTCGVVSQRGVSDLACYEPNNPEEQ